MASSLAAQLSQIAANSTHQLDLKAQRVAHSQSLIFEKKVAASQSFDTIYQISLEGFQELCALDSRFAKFQRNIFSGQSRTEDRLEMTESQNKELDRVLEDFLALVGARLLLTPAVKAVDWLVRRFRVHEHNTSFLLLTFLPYHTTPLFLNLLSILPETLSPTFKALYPYKRSLTNPPRQAIVQGAATNKHLFSALNDYVLHASKGQAQYQGLVSFWAGITTEALAILLDSARSGRIEVEKRNMEDVLLRILPVLHAGFALKKAPDVVMGCYMICVVIANKGSLDDTVLDGLMEAVAGTWTQDTSASGVICLSTLAERKDTIALPSKVVKSVARLEDAASKLVELCGRYPMTKFTLGVIMGCMQSIDKQKGASFSTLVEDILNRVDFKPEETSKALLIVVHAADDLRKSRRMSEQVRTQLSEIFTRFNESDRLREPFQTVIRTSGVDIDQLQLSLEMVVESNAPPKAIEDVEMAEAADVDRREDDFTASIESIPQQTGKEASFLEGQPTTLFNQLARAFTQSFDDESRLLRFLALPVLKHDSALQDPTFISFFLRFFSGPYSPSAKVAAIKVVADTLTKNVEKAVDTQALLPYIMTVLADPAEKVRREAANLLAAFGRSFSKFKHDSNENRQVWAANSLYEQNEQSKAIKWLPSKEIYKITHRALLTALEEFVLDASHIGGILETALRGSSDSVTKKPPTDFELKKTLRTDFFTFLCSHICNTPIFAVKLRLLNIINRIAKVGSTSRTQELTPLFNQWRLMREDEAARVASNEKLDITTLDSQIVGIVSPKDKDSAEILISSVISQPNPPRPAFVAAVFNRLKETWPSMKDGREVAVADGLLEITLGAKSGDAELKNSCKDLLRSVDLSGSVLSSFVNKVSVSAMEVDTQSPATKRRRTSQNRMVALSLREPEELDSLMGKMTFILELVDGSSPENHPELLGGLFQILTALHQLKMQVQSEMSYLLSLVLGIMLAIVNKAKESPKYKLDTSSIRADLIIDCIRGSENPQVQNTALLMIAGLAVVAPELVLHSIMPIFTFMGSNVLKKDDEYSALVIDQTIDQVVPPLIQSLRTQKRDVVSGTSELLLSFTAAFEHIPSHRRLRLFEALITKLGTADFLFAVFAMLANRYAMNKDVLSLMTSLTVNVSAELQLQTYIRYLNLARDALQPKPGLSRTLLGVGDDDGREPQSVVADLLQALAHLLGQASLATKMSKSFELADSEPESQISTLFSTILEQTLHLADNVKGTKSLSKACGDVLGSLLGTLSLIDFLDTIEVLLQRPNDDLRRKVLRLLESRLEQGHERDTKTQERVLAFLSNLVDIIENSSDVLLKHAAVACMERIADKYGRKDPTALAKAAKTVAGSHCIGLTDNRLRIMGVLCLASMTEVLGQAIIPVLPDALSRSSDLLRISMEAGKEKPQLHDAVYSFISSLLVHVPFMVSDNYLDSILQLSFKSTNADIPEESEENRQEALQLLAQRVEVDEVFKAVERNWDSAVAEGPEATRELLNITEIAIAKHPKSATVRNVSVLMKLLYKAFDIRRAQFSAGGESPYDPSDIERVESNVNEVAIKMVYKLNDTMFRSLFIQLTDWATKELAGKDTAGLTMRLTTFYKFLTAFFGNLKSIVTGYSSYILESVVGVLKTVRPTDSGSKNLWLASISMLRNSFEHDRDEFWQSPSHLTAISEPLILQLSYATNTSTSKLVIAEVIPTIVELAVAADSPDNYKELNTAIMKFFRMGNNSTGGTGGENPYTRLVAVKCEQSLTERLGEEWLALLPEMLPYISELMEDEDENVEKEVRKWILAIEEVLGEKLDDMLM